MSEQNHASHPAHSDTRTDDTPEGGDGAGAVSGFTLEIHFHCLFCYAPQAKKNDPKGLVHVIAPDTKGHGEEFRHVVRVVHVRPDRFDVIRVRGREDWAEGWAVELPTNQTTGALVSLHDSIIDLTKNQGKKIKKARVGARPGPEVASRFTLGEGRATTCVVDTFWKMGGKNIDVAREVVWTVDRVPGNALQWSRSELNLPDGQNPQTEELDEIPAEAGFLRLDIFHVLASDFPPPFRRRIPADTAAHFNAFHPLFDLEQGLAPTLRVQEDSPPSFTVGCASVKGEVDD